MENLKYHLSPYHYDSGLQMKVVQNKKPGDAEVRGNELAIIRVLAVYKILDKKCIAIQVNRAQAPEKRKPDYEKEIRILFKAGYLRKYEYETAPAGRANLVLFALTEKGAGYATDRQMRFTYAPLGDCKRYGTASVLEQMTLNKWHIAVTECYKGSVKNEIYEAPARVLEDKNTIIPSCITLKNEEWSLLKEFSVAAVPFWKKTTEEAQGAFLNSVLSVNAFFNHNRRTHKRSFIIILADSFEQMEQAHDLLYSYKPLLKLQVYFAMDEYINSGSPLKWLFELERSGDGINSTYTRIDLTQKEAGSGKEMRDI